MIQISYQLNNKERFLAFDALASATPTLSAQVTERNVETGANIADHYVPSQVKLSFEAYITNAPIAIPDTDDNSITGSSASVDIASGAENWPYLMPRSAQLLAFDDEFDRCRDAYSQLVEIVENKLLVSVTFDRLPAFNGMVLVNLSAPITVDDGDAIKFTFDAVKIRFVDSQTVDVAVTPTASRSRGHQPTTPATEQQSKSFAAATADLILGGK